MKKRLLSGILAFCMVLLLLPIATEATTNKTQAEAVVWAKSQIGKSLDYDGAYGAQCVDLIYYYYSYLGKTVMGGDASAYAYNTLPSGWSRVKYSSGVVPKAGDIAVWSYAASSAGHVAIVLSGDSGGFTAIDQNWRGSDGDLKCKQVYHNYTYGTLACFIRPDFRGSPPPDIPSNFTCSITSPSGTIEAKKACVVRGSVTSARTITKINAWVENASGKTVISASCNPGGTSFSFAGSTIDKNLVFQNVTENGQYYFKVTISDDKTTSKTYSFPFTVTGGTDPVQRPGKSELINMSSTYISGEPIVFSWKNTSNTTHYNVYIQENSSGSWKTLKHIKYAENGITSWTLTSEGNYRAAVQSYNSNGWESDHSDWLHTESDYVYFTVVSGKPTNVKVVTDKPQYEAGEIVRITPSATGAKGFNMWICYEKYGDDTTVLSFSNFIGSKIFMIDRPGTYIVRVTAIGENENTDAECSFIIVASDSEPVVPVPADPDPEPQPTPDPVPTADTLTIYYDANGGSGAPDAQTVPMNKNFDLPTKTPIRDGYTFDGWYANQTCEGEPLSNNTSLFVFGFAQGNDNITLYAGWTPNNPVAGDREDVHFEQQTIYFQGQFTDVPADQWFTKSVASAFELALMKGNSATTFNPYGDVTLAEAITMASRIHSIYTTGSENFIQTGKWYQVYLDYALENGIITKAYYNADVNHKATRAQFAEIFSKSLPDKALYPINTIGENAIPDVKSTDSYAPYVYKLYRAGILTGGDARGTFSPGTYITRAESAAIVSRMAESNNRVALSLN